MRSTYVKHVNMVEPIWPVSNPFNKLIPTNQLTNQQLPVWFRLRTVWKDLNMSNLTIGGAMLAQGVSIDTPGFFFFFEKYYMYKKVVLLHHKLSVACW